MLEWVGASKGGVYRWENDRWELVSARGDLPQSLLASVAEGEEALKFCNELVDEQGSWVIAKVPPESEKPMFIFVAAFEQPQEPEESAIQVSAELLSSWLTPRENNQDWEQLARSFRVATLGELAAGIAHEINNPLQVIIGNAELILDTEELGEKTKEKLTDILRAAEQIRKIAHSVTHFADARRTEEKELLDFNKVVQEASQLVSYSLVRDGVRVSLELSPTPPIWGRRGDLEEIVVQLVRNAGEAITESGKGSQVIVRTGTQGNWVRLEVEDDGPGIPTHLRDSIFNPFVTTKAARGGTGLGLAIIQNIVSAHNGRIWLEDSQTGGAKFIVELPTW
ncbi:MAG: sensor histidine kinase [Candidatus Fervidibacter sp.]|uniref:sensor histidine kinase n=1 Tax=Candidatus Fervidibacter sp. TaxID=3100871 RepID=UPI00404A2D82